MNARDQASQISLERNVNKAKSLALDLLLPSTQIEHICNEIDYRFRNCVYSPMVTVWLFISQVISGPSDIIVGRNAPTPAAGSDFTHEGNGRLRSQHGSVSTC